MRNSPMYHKMLHRQQNITRIAITVLALAFVLPMLPTPQVAEAQAALPPVSYDTLNHTIFVGADYNPADPAQAAYAEYPSDRKSVV